MKVQDACIAAPKIAQAFHMVGPTVYGDPTIASSADFRSFYVP